MKSNEKKKNLKRIKFCELSEVARRNAIHQFRKGALESLISPCPENNKKSVTKWCVENLSIYERVDIIVFFEDGTYEIFL